MRKFLLLFCFALVWSGVAAEGESNAGKTECAMVFASAEHNFGEIGERDGKVSHVFEFRNDGEHPIVITRMMTTCKCTDYDFSRRPVPPGGKGRITVTYNPKKQKGVFYKVVHVYTNCAQERVMLTIRGEVRTYEKGK